MTRMVCAGWMLLLSAGSLARAQDAGPLVAPAAATAPAAGWTPQATGLVTNAAEREALTRGEILVHTEEVKGSSVPRAVTRAVVDAPPARVWAIVSDCSSYARTMPRIAESKELKREGDEVTCRVVADMPFPMSNLTNVSRAKHSQVDGVFKREWNLVEGDYKLNRGSWVVAPLDAEGKRSVVIYTLHVEPNVPLPRFLVNGAQKKALPDLIRGLREQTKGK